MSVLACGAIVALLVMAGLAVDGAAQMAAQQRAAGAANQVARFAMDAAAPYLVDGEDGRAAAIAAAQSAADGFSGLRFEFALDESGRLQVRASTTIDTVFLPLIGINQLNATGQASAIVFRP